MSVGSRVEQLRNQRGWSQDELAKAMTERGFAVRQTTISGIERGAEPKAPMLRALAITLGVTVDYLVGMDSGGEAASTIPDRLDAIDRQLEALLEEHPEHADESRARLRALRESLRDLGLTDDPS